MNKAMLSALWMSAWGMAMIFAQMTSTKADDNLISAMGSPQMFEEFWAFLVQKGWVKGETVHTPTLRADLELPEQRSA